MRFLLSIHRAPGGLEGYRVWASGNNSYRLNLRSAPKNRAGPHGTLRGAAIGKLRLGAGNLGPPIRVFWSPIVGTPVYGGFADLVSPRWALGGNASPPRNVPRNPTGRYRAQNIGITTRSRN